MRKEGGRSRPIAAALGRSVPAQAVGGTAWGGRSLGQGSGQDCHVGLAHGREGIGTASWTRILGHFGAGSGRRVSRHFGARQRSRASGQFVGARWRAWGIRTVGWCSKKNVSLRTNFLAQHRGAYQIPQRVLWAEW